jgi:hypothetical protein
MRISGIWRSRGWFVFAGSTLITFVVLIGFGLRQVGQRSFSLGGPATIVAVVQPGAPVCQQPITPPSTTRTVAVWGRAYNGSPQPTVVFRPVDGQGVAARGVLVPSAASQYEYRARLNRNLPGGRSFRVCVQATGGGFGLWGDTAVSSRITMTGGGKGLLFSLVLWRSAGSTLLGSLPTAFARASLFKLSWLHPWVFWLLCALLLSTIVLGSVAIGAADREDTLADVGEPLPPGRRGPNT